MRKLHLVHFIIRVNQRDFLVSFPPERNHEKKKVYPGDNVAYKSVMLFDSPTMEQNNIISIPLKSVFQLSVESS